MARPLPQKAASPGGFRRPATKGFTLVEVILSIVILVVGLIAVQRTLLGSVSALSLIENWDQAESLLQEKIWEYKRIAAEKPKTLKPTQQHGVLLGKNRTYLYDLVIRSINADATLMEAYLKIFWENQGVRHSLPRVFYLRVPDAKNTKDAPRV